MPNHVTNILTIVGDNVNEIKEKIKGQKKDEFIDFNKIIPMPESLNITSGTSTDNAIAVIKYQEMGDSSEINKIMGYNWAVGKSRDEVVKSLIGTANMIEGRKAIDNIKKYGHKDWYSWCVENWGTKWGAYSQALDGESIIFDTAWSSPLPVIDALSKMYPDNKFIIKYADEDSGSNCGEYAFQNGKIVSEKEFDYGIDSLLFTNEVKGYTSGYGIISVISSSKNEKDIDRGLSYFEDRSTVNEILDNVDEIDDIEPSDIFINKLKNIVIKKGTDIDKNKFISLIKKIRPDIYRDDILSDILIDSNN